MDGSPRAMTDVREGGDSDGMSFAAVSAGSEFATSELP